MPSDGRSAALRLLWTRSIRPWWSAYQAVVVATLALATLALAYAGTTGQAPAEPLSDRLLRLLSAFGLGYPLLANYEHPAAKAARWLAAAVTIATIAKVWSTIFRAQVGALSSRWKSGHAVICGVGEVGTSIGLSLREAGIPVVGIDRVPRTGAGGLRSRGVATIEGDARDEMSLRLAGIERARFLVAVCGDDEVNAEVLATARRVVGAGRHTPLTCVVHVSDLVLRRLMRSAEFAARPDDPIRLQCVNLEERAARALLADRPPPLPRDGKPPHVLLVGLGRFGESLLLRLGRWWVLQGRPERVVVSVVDHHASSRCATLLAHQRALAARCAIHSIEASSRSAEFESGEIWRQAERIAPVDAVYVCLADAEASIAAALTLQGFAADREVPITVRTRREIGLASLLAAGPIGFDGTLKVFPVLPRTCNADLVLQGTNEQIAQVLHDHYLRHAAEDADLRDTRALRPWSELPEAVREANRLRADQIAALLRQSGLRVVPAGDWDARPRPLERAQVERLAELEHMRWLERRRGEGWTFGAARDDERKVTPLLVPWSELAEKERERNRAEIERLPSILAQADLAIVLAGAEAG